MMHNIHMYGDRGGNKGYTVLHLAISRIMLGLMTVSQSFRLDKYHSHFNSKLPILFINL